MHYGTFPSVDLDLKGMQFFQLAANFGRVTGGPYRVHPPLRLQGFRYGLSLDILHGHVVAAVHFAGIVNFEEARVYIVKLFLDERSPTLRFEHNLGPGISGLLYNFEDGVAII